ncbi:MAG: CDP-glycerol glycerophosphotransferase family protein [Patescibacteria group bacterium]|nr:CDP-glycerol glycerophosphotransferase family protein [Patescibacteria group bacterium]
MKLKQATEIIIDIENLVPVDQIEFKDIKIWPLIRSEIWKQLTNPVKERSSLESSASTNKNYFEKIISKILRVFTYTKYSLFKKKQKQKQVIFLPSPNNRWEKVNGQYLKPFSNSLQDILREMKIKSIILNYSSTNPKPLYGNFYHIRKEIEHAHSTQRILLLLEKIFNLNKKPSKVYHWDTLIKFISFKYPILSLDKQSIIDQTNNIISYEKIFKKIFKKIKPKLCFLICYYCPINMGYIKACRSLGIKSVEIQHGQQGDFHGMYTHWTKLPQNGYELLPSHWWSWGNKSAERINNWSKTVHPEHQAIVGGNPWIAKNINQDYKIDDTYIDKLEKILTLKNKINVLVALQPIEIPISNTLFEAIKNSPSKINWLIRLHPAMSKQKNEIEQFLKKTNNKNIDIDYNYKIPLFNILKRVDFLITPWSSIAYEALLFKVHPIIIHPNGKDTFTEYINEGLFTYADSSQKIINVIETNKNKFIFNEKQYYIEIDIFKIKNLLKKIIK